MKDLKYTQTVTEDKVIWLDICRWFVLVERFFFRVSVLLLWTVKTAVLHIMDFNSKNLKMETTFCGKKTAQIKRLYLVSVLLI